MGNCGNVKEANGIMNGKIVKVPECVHQNLCYSKVFKDNELLTEPVKECLGLFDIVDSKLAKKYKLEFGPSRSLIDWFQ